MGGTQIFKRDDVISNQPNLTKTFPKCRQTFRQWFDNVRFNFEFQYATIFYQN